MVNSQSAVLDVSTSASDKMDTGASEFGVGGRTAELKLALLLVNSALSTGRTALVSAVTANAHPLSP